MLGSYIQAMGGAESSSLKLLYRSEGEACCTYPLVSHMKSITVDIGPRWELSLTGLHYMEITWKDLD